MSINVQEMVQRTTLFLDDAKSWEGSELYEMLQEVLMHVRMKDLDKILKRQGF
jgi:hypothetical protein